VAEPAGHWGLSVGDRKLLLRFDGDGRIGSGHASRCLALGEAAGRRGLHPVFVARSLPEGLETRMARAGDVVRVPDIGWEAEARKIDDDFDLAACVGIVLDVTTPYALEEIEAFRTYTHGLGTRCGVTVLDGLPPQTLYDKIETYDAVVIPYATFDAEGRSESHGRIRMVGPEYFICGHAYAGDQDESRPFLEAGTRVLVTMGGADPCRLTQKAINALERLERTLDVRVVVGPSFSEPLMDGIQASVSTGHHQYQIVEAPDTLAPHMRWCDIAVGATGLTKYELALTGTPSILLSIDEAHATINRPFEARLTSQHLGEYKDVSTEALGGAVEKLLSDVQARQRMAEAGMQLVDGLGATRVLEEIEGIAARRHGGGPV